MEKLSRDDHLFSIQTSIEYLEKLLKNSSGNLAELNMKLSNAKQKYKQVMNQKNFNSYTITVTTTKSSEYSLEEREIANKFHTLKKHDETLHKKILLKYTKSAALAPADSEELALAINNRSVILLHLKKYKNCIIDIDYVLSVTKSVVLKCKLICRKVKCLLAMNKLKEAKNIYDEAFKILENIPKKDEDVKIKLSKELQEDLKKNYPKFKAQDKKAEVLDLKNTNKLPYISEIVSFKYNSKFGKHLVADRDIKTGEILTVEKIYCIYPDVEKLYLICSHCLKFTFNGRPCKNCVFAVYCSIECEKLAFEEYHDIECSINPLLFATPTNYTSPNAYYARLFIKLLKEFGVEKLIQQAKILDENRAENNASFAENGNALIQNFNAFQCLYGLIDQMDQKTDTVDENFSQFFLETMKKKNYFDDLSFENISILNRIFANLILKDPYGFQLYSAKFTDLQIDGTRANDIDAYGNSVTQVASLLNHNCYHNSGRVFTDGAKFFTFATRPIKKNEQVYTNYRLGIEFPIEQRKMILKLYNFECNCLACVNNWPTVNAQLFQKIFQNPNINKKVQTALKEYSELKFFKDFEPWEYNKKNIQQFCDIIDKSYSAHSTLEGAALISQFMQTLNILFYSVYNEYFDVPNTC